MKKTLNKSLGKIQSITICFVVIMFGFGMGLSAQRVVEKPLYLDPFQPVEKRVNDLISRLTITEKAIVLDRTLPLPRLNINNN